MAQIDIDAAWQEPFGAIELDDFTDVDRPTVTLVFGGLNLTLSEDEARTCHAQLSAALAQIDQRSAQP
jgi:hypothetical protein